MNGDELLRQTASFLYVDVNIPEFEQTGYLVPLRIYLLYSLESLFTGAGDLAFTATGDQESPST
jgi:hypothetical protein